MHVFLFILAFSISPLFAFAQLPSSDVWLFPYSYSSDGYRFGTGKNISNQKGYDNQPSFSFF